MGPELRTERRPPKIVRIVRARPRFFVCMLCGLLAAMFLLLVAGWPARTAFLTAWDVALVLYLIAVYHLVTQATLNDLQQRAGQQDEGQVTILVSTVIAALVILAAIIFELGEKGGRTPAHIARAIVTIALSWAFVHTIFALHYAHEYHDEKRAGAGGLKFPGKEQPNYWDFVYFSFVIGMTSQVSDVAVTSSAIRQTVLAHGIASFIFNTTLLALTVNIAVSGL